MSRVSQLSLFSAEARAPSYADLEGLLAGPGQVVTRQRAARIGVVVAEEWRVDALVAELRRLELDAEVEPAEQGTAVRTPFLAELVPIARAWASGAVKRPPQGFALDGARLRWWCLAAGRLGGGAGPDPGAATPPVPAGAATLPGPDPGAATLPVPTRASPSAPAGAIPAPAGPAPALYTLALGANDEQAWPGVGAALAAAGIAGAFVGPRAAGPAYRLVGVRRLTRLRELVGDPPAPVPPGGWPPAA